MNNKQIEIWRRKRNDELYMSMSPSMRQYWKKRDRKSWLQHVLCLLFSIIYRKWLYNDFYKRPNRVLKVTGWRSARVASVGKDGREISRWHMSPCFWNLK